MNHISPIHEARIAISHAMVVMEKYAPVTEKFIERFEYDKARQMLEDALRRLPTPHEEN